MCCPKTHLTKGTPENKWYQENIVSGKRKWIPAWKALHPSGRSRYGNYSYSPGHHTATVRRYNTLRPRGIHVYMYPHVIRFGVPIKVWCNRDTFVRAGGNQAVFREIKILKKDWIDTGLPVPHKPGAKRPGKQKQGAKPCKN